MGEPRPGGWQPPTCGALSAVGAETTSRHLAPEAHMCVLPDVGASAGAVRAFYPYAAASGSGLDGGLHGELHGGRMLPKNKAAKARM